MPKQANESGAAALLGEQMMMVRVVVIHGSSVLGLKLHRDKTLSLHLEFSVCQDYSDSCP